jgi:hypothetical protein
MKKWGFYALVTVALGVGIAVADVVRFEAVVALGMVALFGAAALQAVDRRIR